jgi:NADPH:quinone reductase-like Zn-dependent oxidoreductase
MRAAVIDGPGPPEAFRIVEVDVPQLRRGDILIALDFASVGIWDAKERAGEWRSIDGPTVLGADGAGTVAAVGEGVETLRVGERVYAYSYDNPGGGFYAEYVRVRAEAAAPVPPQFSQEIAGAIPCVALTALAGIEALRIKAEQVLLVFGASGGVGSLAVWLASGMKATVVGVARPDTYEYVHRLGAPHVLPPHPAHFESAIARASLAGWDAAFVTANGDSLPAFLAHLKRDAPLAYPDGVEPEPVALRHPVIAVSGEASPRSYAHLAALIGDRILPLELTVFPLSRVAEAHRRVERGHVVGKVVLRIPER